MILLITIMQKIFELYIKYCPLISLITFIIFSIYINTYPKEAVNDEIYELLEKNPTKYHKRVAITSFVGSCLPLFNIVYGLSCIVILIHDSLCKNK